MKYFLKAKVPGYLAALVAVAIIIVALYTGRMLLLAEAERLNRNVELNIWQKALVTDISTLAHQISRSEPGPDQLSYRFQMHARIATFESNQLALTNDLRHSDIFPIHDHGAEQHLKTAYSRITPLSDEFISQAKQFLEEPNAINRLAFSDRLRSLATRELAQEIEVPLHIYRRDRDRITNLAKLDEQISVIALLVAIVGFAWFVIYPLTKNLRTQSAKLSVAEGQIRERALLDSVTGLPNNAALTEFVATLCEAPPGSYPKKLAILLEIAPIARTHRLRDERLYRAMFAKTAERLYLLAGEMDYLAHCGRGRFFIFCEEPDIEGNDPQILERIALLLFDPFDIEDNRISVGLHAGFYPIGSGLVPKTLIADTELALESAISAGSFEHILFAPEMREKQEKRTRIGAELREALTERHLKAFFQPQVDLRTGKVTGFEGLIRWLHPERGIQAPGTFLEIAGELGLDDELGEIMLNQGLDALKAWDAAGFDIRQIGLNFSEAELSNPNLAETLRWELDKAGIDPERLAVEVLENIYVESDEDRIVRNVRALADMGACIDLDDFGTGTASITGLRRFRASRIKIDKSYIRDIHTNRDNQQLVSTMINMATGLGIDTLAEGVETSAELLQLRSLGCKAVQGYHIAKPMPFADTITWLETYNADLAVRREQRSVAV